MSPVAAEIDRLAAALPSSLDLAALRVLDRNGELPLGPPGAQVSPNGACRLIRAADGWMALNLARDEDRDLVPAWLGCNAGEPDPWALVDRHAHARTVAGLREMAILLGLPAAPVGEAAPGGAHAPIIPAGEAGRPPAAPRVLDLSALWAGPLCGAVLAALGAEVTKVESVRRPDPTRLTTPGFHDRLNGRKQRQTLDLAASEGQAALNALADACDVVITSARPRGLASIGLDPRAWLAARRGRVWVAITGHGLDAPDRVAFGDDAAAAGGLLACDAAGAPAFLGDALSDPVTGLAAAVGAVTALAAGGGRIVDAGMSACAARAARTCGLQVVA